jgi:hypothetical protein
MSKLRIGSAFLVAMVLCGGLAARRAEAGPLDQLLSLLTDPDTGLAAIRRQLTALEDKFTGSAAAAASFQRSSGLFSLPAGAVAVDWTVVNDATTSQTFTVTVFQAGVGAKTVVPPGALTFTLAPGSATHNANNVSPTGPFIRGFNYEVVIQSTSPNVLPSCEVWEDSGNTVIPGTLIPPGSWVRLQ